MEHNDTAQSVIARDAAAAMAAADGALPVRRNCAEPTAS